MIKITTIEQLLEKPVCLMTGQELAILLDRKGNADAQVSTPTAPEKHYEYGIEGLARVFGCSIPTANRIKKSGVIDAAISQIGRKIVVDADLALALAKEAGTVKING